MNSFFKHFGNNHISINSSEKHVFGEINFKKYIGKSLSDKLYDDLVYKLHVEKIRIYKPGDCEWCDAIYNACIIYLDENDMIEDIKYYPDFSLYTSKLEIKKYKEILLIIEGLCLAEAESHDEIYKIVHSFLGFCGNFHEDWKKEIDGIKKKLKEDKIIDVDKVLLES